MKNKQGYTVIELIVCITIIGVLAAVALPAYKDFVNRQNAGKMISSEERVDEGMIRQ